MRSLVLPVAITAKQRYLTLDGLRGIAAIAVMIYHRRSWSPSGHLLEHAHLAVDFFFLLSGFVIAHAYERRLLTRMSIGEFMRARLLRFYPLILLGTVLGGAYFLTDTHLRQNEQWMSTVLLTLSLAMFALPTPQALADQPFPINPPAWSLFNELLVNLLYALLVRILSTGTLAMIIAVSFVAELSAACHYGTLGPIGNQFGTLLAAIPRTTLPFFLGVLLYRLHTQDRLPKRAFGVVPLSLLLVASFLPSSLKFCNALYDVLCVCLLYPTIIILGCRHQPQGTFARAATQCADLSFPIYALHFPLFYWFSFVATRLGFKDGQPVPGYLLVAISLIIAASFVALRAYDMPMRRWLSVRKQRARLTDEVVRSQSHAT